MNCLSCNRQVDFSEFQVCGVCDYLRCAITEDEIIFANNMIKKIKLGQVIVPTR